MSAGSTKRLVYEFFGLDSGATATFDRMEGNLARGGGAWSKYATNAGLAVAAVAVYAIKQAADFQQSTELIHTQAGRSIQDLATMRKGILDMAGAVGTGPEALSEALFHIASTGLSASKSLDELRVAAEGAKVGNANLTDVTNALNAVIVANVKGAGDMAHAMGALNAIVGAGDMHMQDLSDALGGTGLLAIMKTFGVTLNQGGAALATFGDNGVRGSQAATYLRQAIQSLSVASPNADKALAKVGLTSQNLTDALAHGGLTGALTTLHDHFVESGLDANRWGNVLEQAFTKKAGTGISILLTQFGRYQTKQQEVADGAAGFGDAWSATTKNLTFQLDRVRAGLEADAVTIGTDLIPVAMDFLKVLFATGSAISDTIGWLDKHKTVADALAAVLAATLTPAALDFALVMSEGVNKALGLVLESAGAAVAPLLAMAAAEDEVAASAVEMDAMNPVLAAAALAVGALTFSWLHNKQAAAAAKQGVDDFVTSLHTNTNSIASLRSGVEQLTTKYQPLTNAARGFAAQGNGLIANAIKGGATYKEYASQLQTYQGQIKTVTTNTAAMSNEFGISRGKVQQLAQAAGVDLTGSLQSVEAGIGGAIKAAQLSHHPLQQAGQAFDDMGSSATDAAGAIQDLDTAWNSYIGNFIGLKQAQDDFNAALRQTRADLKKSGGSLKDTGGAATTARDDFLSLVGKIHDVTSANYTNTQSMAKALAAAKNMRDGIQQLGASGPLAQRSLSKLNDFISNFSGKLRTQGATAGSAWDQGLLGGIHSLWDDVVNAAESLAGKIDSAARGPMGIDARSPSRKGTKTGQNYGKSVAGGLDSTQKEVTIAAARVANLLDAGMRQGWTGMADSIKNALGTNVQNALSAFTDHLTSELKKQQDAASSAESALTSLVKARKSAITSLSSSVAGSADISNVLGLTNVYGQSYTGNIASFLNTQIGPLKAEARGLAKLRKMGLSQALLSQISGLAPSDAVTLINQITGGQDGSIAYLNSLEHQIRSYAKQTATTVVESPHEKAQLAAARMDVFWAKLGVQEQRITNRHLERLAAHGIGSNIVVHVSGSSTHVSNAQAKEIAKALNRLTKQGINVLAPPNGHKKK